MESIKKMVTTTHNPKNGAAINQVAVIGCGAMGGGIALLFAENGHDVELQDPLTAAMEKVIATAKVEGLKGKITAHQDYKTLCGAFDKAVPKVFVWSLPHGSVGDVVLNGLMPYLKKGDVIVDCANEHWENTERRQGISAAKGIRYIGCGVSGGYQAARRGPSMCPGSDDETMGLYLPLLEQIAAKAPDGVPCVAKIGTGGAGHYCKMIHNGIEHGMMSAIAEAYGIMRVGLGMDLDAIGDELHRWNAEGELKGTFLVRIGAEICHTKDESNGGERVLDTVVDKVVQDCTGEEGTGIWSNLEAVDQHVPAPTLTSAHYLRLASADLRQRRRIKATFAAAAEKFGNSAANKDHHYPPQKISSASDKAAFLEDLRLAVYLTCVASYVQGLNVIDKADVQKHFNVDFNALLQIWRAGCIIQADFIVEKILAPIYRNNSFTSPTHAKDTSRNPLYDAALVAEFVRTVPHLKKIVLAGVQDDHPIPALSATLEYVKIQTSTELPTNFYEAQLDYFGAHMYDKKGEDEEGLPEEGKYHYEWKKA